MFIGQWRYCLMFEWFASRISASVPAVASKCSNDSLGNCSVDVVTRLRDQTREILVRIPAIFSKTSRQSLKSTQAPNHRVKEVIPVAVRRPEGAADHSLQISTMFENALRYTSTSPHIFITCNYCNPCN
jgi:hypothetical protein